MGNNLKTYAYSVNLRSGLKTVQQALDRLTFELRGEPVVTKDVIITVGRGVYPGFSLERGTLMPFLGTGHQVVIRAGGSYFPIIDGAHSPRGVHIGADIDSANPNLEIRGLRFQKFSVGVRYTNNSHNPIVRDCIVSNNKNVGILVEQCSNTILSNNVVINGDFGIVTRLCKNIALLHNTVLMNGETGQGEAAVWAQLANDYGGGQTDTGQLHILGNIFWNMTKNPTLVFFKEDLEEGRVISNFNDFVRTGDTLIAIEKKNSLPNVPRDPYKVFGLKAWKSLGFLNPNKSPLDGKSISQDPKFLQVLKGRGKTNGLYIDLSLLPISPVLGIVPSFHFSPPLAAAWLPTYVDAVEILGKDILGNARLTDGTAAGANEKRSNSGYFGQDIFLTPRNLNPNKDCDADPLRDLIYKRLDLWFPQLRVGFFSSHEREYYLYSQKHCRHLGECAVTEFRLPARIITDRPVKLSVAGENIKDPRYIDIRGDMAILYHFDLDIQDGTEEFEIQCWIRRWNATTLAFFYLPVHYRFKINEGRTRYLIPPDYESSGPVVITDDASSMPDNEVLSHREFTVKWDDEEQRAEILLLNNTNKLVNGQFDKELGDTISTPYAWSASGAFIKDGMFFSGFNSVMGDKVCKVEPTGYLGQIVPMTSGNFSLSWHSIATDVGAFAPVTVGNTGLFYQVTLYDASYDPLGVVFSGAFSTTGEWTRNYITFGKEDPNIDQTARVGYDLINRGNHPGVPEVCAYADVSFHNSTEVELGQSRDLWIDAIQYEETPRPTMYHRKVRFHELTVEYETSDSEQFIDTRQALAPVRNKMSQGFLYIPEIPAAMYGGPQEAIVTTLYEKRWADGRKQVLPWARLTGKDKLRHKQIFNTVPEPPKPRIELSNTTFFPFEIAVIPDTIIARQGDRNGVGLEITCFNDNGNPYSLGKVYTKIKEPLGRFPGWLHKRFLGANEQMGSEIFTLLDSAGSLQILWVPPDGRSVMYVGSAPNRPLGGSDDALSFIETNYRVNDDFHGNVIVLDNHLQPMPTRATQANRNIYKPSYEKNKAIVTVKYPITPGSVRVQVDGDLLTETFVDSPNSDQFYVNYVDSLVILRGRPEKVDVEYLPTYACVNPGDPYNILFYHDQVFGNYTGPITVGYDAQIDLDISVAHPAPKSAADTAQKKITLIAQNHLVASNRHVNPLSAEY